MLAWFDNSDVHLDNRIDVMNEYSYNTAYRVQNVREKVFVIICGKTSFEN